MRFARVCTPDGVVRGRFENGMVESAGRRYRIGDGARLLPPCDPSAIYCVGRNYAETIEYKGYERPDHPSFFIKPRTALCAPNSSISYPAFSDEVTYGGELAGVIAERCRDVAPDDVPGIIRGYTVLNDLDALDQPSLTARKAFDEAAPLGPCVTTNVEPTGLDMETTVNGEVRQRANTASMLFDPHEIVSYLSSRCTLEPDDVVSFGSPANPGVVEPGDEIEIRYEGVGTLRNWVE